MTQESLSRILAAGSLPIHLVLLLTGAALGGWLTRLDARDWPLPARTRAGIFAAVLIGGLAGCAVPAFLASDLIAELAFGQWRGPKTIMGGILGGFVGAAIWKKAWGIPYDTSDAFARGTCLMMAVGRLGCLAQHCCFGIPCPPAIGWDQGDGVTRLPVQAIEAALVFALFLVLDRLHRTGRARHRRLFVLFLGYGLLRFGLEFLREQYAGLWLGLGFYQWLALVLAAVGAWQIRKRSPARNAASTAPDPSPSPA